MGGALDVWFVFAFCADARYAQKFLQLVQMFVLLRFYGFDKIHSVLRQEFEVYGAGKSAAPYKDSGTLPHSGLRFYGTLCNFSKLFATVFLDTLQTRMVDSRACRRHDTR